ncbi:cell wall invertase [Artemisia annua]|uniref:Cell wall invertase n=1 Tax=Artemisia annua TaxID=35608 RepID=A0A2U1LII6_ARTAN|nr:cell wall invertase [Artemisia annua]
MAISQLFVPILELYRSLRLQRTKQAHNYLIIINSCYTKHLAMMRITYVLLLVILLQVLHFDHVQSNTITLEALYGLRLEQPYRTAFHFQPPQNWMNGPMYYNGVYHNFYQHNPFGPLFGNIHWAHSVSHDLINWIPLEPALAPTDPFDKNGCYSGSTIILPGNKPVMLYTGADNKSHQVQNLAVPKDLSDPYLREWVKYSDEDEHGCSYPTSSASHDIKQHFRVCHVKNDEVVVASLGTSRGSSKKLSLDYLCQQ